MAVINQLPGFSSFLFVLVHTNGTDRGQLFDQSLQARHGFIVCEVVLHSFNDNDNDNDNLNLNLNLNRNRNRTSYSSSEKCTSTRLYELKIFDLLTKPR